MISTYSSGVNDCVLEEDGSHRASGRAVGIIAKLFDQTFHEADLCEISWPLVSKILTGSSRLHYRMLFSAFERVVLSTLG